MSLITIALVNKMRRRSEKIQEMTNKMQKTCPHMIKLHGDSKLTNVDSGPALTI